MKNKYQNIPAVHRKVKKKDMLFEYVLIGVLILFLIYIIIDVSNLIPELTNKINLASVAGAVVALYALIWQLHLAIKGSKVLASVDLSATVDGDYVTLSCSITNSGTKSIYPYLTNLYINEGKENERKESNSDGTPCRYCFEAITEHQINRTTGECFDCKLAQHCKGEAVNDLGKITFPPCEDDIFNDTIRYCCNLRQLSYYAIVHIMPKETFREDVVLKISKPGVYRAIVIYTGKEWDDCICTTQVFRIKEKSQ